MLKNIADQMDEMIEEGYVRKVDPEQKLDKEKIPCWVMPTVFDKRQGKPKIRICHDAKSSVGGVSLNGELLPGPDNMNSLLGILFRGRRHQVVYSADIKGFYHQIGVKEEDSHVFRFWWFERDEPGKYFLCEMPMQIFGAKSSPSIAKFTLDYHAESLDGVVPLSVVETIRRSFYIDDLWECYKEMGKEPYRLKA